MAVWNITTENILGKRRIQFEKYEDENFKLSMKNSYKLQDLVSNNSIFSDHGKCNFNFDLWNIKREFKREFKDT